MKNNCLTLTLIFFFSFIFYSCGEDAPVTQNSVKVIYSLDSLSAWNPPGIAMVSGTQVYINRSVPSSRVKVEYTVETNVDSIHSNAWLRDSSNAEPKHVFEQHYFNGGDSAVSYTINIPYYLYLTVDIWVESYSNSTISHYVKLRNIKVITQ